MKILALIPARGGSKGIKKKNIIRLKGKPLIAYTIECSLKSRFINRVIVSTDSIEIAEIAKKYGAEVPFIRPKKFAQDTSPDIDAFYHALTWLRDKENYTPDIVLNMRPVCPLRKVEVVDRAIKTFINNPHADSLRAVCHPRELPYKMWRKKDKFIEPLLPYRKFKESFNMPRQVLPEVLYQHGYVDMVRTEVILKYKLMSGKKILPFFCENLVDIDYPKDLIMAEKILNDTP
jgi:N-acylneuraminate cytidylyltransferase